jgi:tRNA threonylcarbamoyladenosine biosynthesis protein TsaE
MKTVVACLDEVKNVAKAILELVPKNAILILDGTLAAGKTTLTKEIAKQKGATEEITSPTFSIEHIYSNDIFHYDLYRVDFEELASLGILGEFQKEGLHIIEWIDPTLKEILKEAGFEIFVVEITPKDKCRKYKIYNLKEGNR